MSKKRAFADGALGQIHTVSEFREIFCRLIKADMPVMTKTQKLQIGAATVLYDGFKVIAGFLRIPVQYHLEYECEPGRYLREKTDYHS